MNTYLMMLKHYLWFLQDTLQVQPALENKPKLKRTWAFLLVPQASTQLPISSPRTVSGTAHPQVSLPRRSLQGKTRITQTAPSLLV